MTQFSSQGRRFVIDARPRDAEGLIASRLVLGRSLFAHTLEHARRFNESAVAISVIAEPADRPQLQSLVQTESLSEIRFDAEQPSPRASILRTDRLYEPKRLRKIATRGGDPEGAVLWRLDDPQAARHAEEELIRRRTYQPLGRFWAFPIARMIARRLAPTCVRPNALTLGAGGLMLLSSALVATLPTHWMNQLLIAACLAAALVLDTADGHLARLQGTASPFGKWLDNVLDELADLALHAAIAYAAFARSGNPHWLMVGMLFACGKYMFVIQSSAGDRLDQATSSEHATSTDTIKSGDGGPAGILRAIVRGMGHADVRWHLWILLAAIGHLEVALVAYAAYFPLRAGLACLRRGVHHVIA